MFIDTHCHLNFKAFEGGEATIVRKAQQVQVEMVVVPGTDVPTSQKAVRIAQKNPQVYALVGVHPHHVTHYMMQDDPTLAFERDLPILESLVQEQKVVGMGEIGLDRHTYAVSKYGPSSVVSDSLFALQKMVFLRQLELAHRHGTSVSIHNREAHTDLIQIFEENAKLMQELSHRIVLHCCEPMEALLNLAKRFGCFIGVDGDITYDRAKQEFIRNVPLEMLVLETDAPYLLPEPWRSQKKYPNVPEYLPRIATEVARVKNVSVEMVAHVTTQNARVLFGLPQQKRSNHGK
ncbi:MAG TPA: TatD family hydrolase [Candidatus Woesebacteria bacterium]|nr:TatD family hydrolase [Candidatus Woesebacteria bacterium]HNS94877.1 TatD family hydrolase [Candidatus Woesebacteria bacterium]